MLPFIVVTQSHSIQGDISKKRKHFYQSIFPLGIEKIYDLCDMASISHPAHFVNITQNCQHYCIGSLSLIFLIF